MPFSITINQGKQTLTLEGSVTIRNAQDLAARLSEVLEDRAPLGVNTGELEDIDTSILQLLCAARKTAPSFSLDNPSEVFIAAMDRCGLRRELLGVREGL
jgi:anti-anti-sigma regulatory factor